MIWKIIYRSFCTNNDNSIIYSSTSNANDIPNEIWTKWMYVFIVVEEVDLVQYIDFSNTTAYI